MYQNNYALKFYKLDATDCETESDVMHVLNEINYNGVVTIQVDEQFEQFTREHRDFLKKEHIFLCSFL